MPTVDCSNCGWQGSYNQTDAGYCRECGGECFEETQMPTDERCRKPGCGARRGRCSDWDCPEGDFVRMYEGRIDERAPEARCKYGHKLSGCELGYPGCICADEAMLEDEAPEAREPDAYLREYIGPDGEWHAGQLYHGPAPTPHSDRVRDVPLHRAPVPEARGGWDQLQALVGSVEGPPDLSARYTHPEALEELRSGLAEYDYHGYGYIKLDPQHARTILVLLSERPDALTAAYLLGRYDRRSDAEPDAPGAPCRQCGGPTLRRITRGSPDGAREYDLCERCGWVQPVGDDAGGEREPDMWPGGVSDGLVLPCGVCGQVPRWDYHVDDDLWRRVVPDALRLGVVCLPCLDVLADRAGEDVSSYLREVQWIGVGKTVVLRPGFVHRYAALRPAAPAEEA